MTCCVGEMSFSQVDVTLHSRCDDGDNDDDNRER